MPRSLLDTADLSALRAISAAGPAMALAAALIDTGLLQFDADDPAWEDRDRLVVCGASVSSAIADRMATAGTDAEAVVQARTGGDALALAFGAAAASAMDGGPWRSWCVLDGAACDDGRVWEVARAARDGHAEQLGVLVAGGDTAGMWRACGWQVHEAPAADPAWLLGALDHLQTRGPAVVLATAQ